VQMLVTDTGDHLGYPVVSTLFNHTHHTAGNPHLPRNGKHRLRPTPSTRTAVCPCRGPGSLRLSC
jgi:hypothetical protein